MNPPTPNPPNALLEKCREIDRSGRQIVRAEFDRVFTPTVVVLHCDDGTAEKLPVKVDHETFMEWWRETGRQYRQKAK